MPGKPLLKSQSGLVELNGGSRLEYGTEFEYCSMSTETDLQIDRQIHMHEYICICFMYGYIQSTCTLCSYTCMLIDPGGVVFRLYWSPRNGSSSQLRAPTANSESCCAISENRHFNASLLDYATKRRQNVN